MIAAEHRIELESQSNDRSRYYSHDHILCDFFDLVSLKLIAVLVVGTRRTASMTTAKVTKRMVVDYVGKFRLLFICDITFDFSASTSVKLSLGISAVQQFYGLYNWNIISLQVLQSFKIMDYSLLLAIHNQDQSERDKVSFFIHVVHSWK